MEINQNNTHFCLKPKFYRKSFSLKEKFAVKLLLLCCNLFFFSTCNAQKTTDYPKISNVELLEKRLQKTEQEILQNPQKSQLLLQKAYILDSLQNYLDALETINVFLRKEPQNIAGYYLRGKIKISLRDESGAINDFNKILSLNPKEAEAYFQRGLLRLQFKDTSGACLEFQKAKELKYSKAIESYQKFCQKIN
ncbi:TPR repeat [Raineya orbicola]|uniref:TPR repeat n=1 Tax=Raineya orbicola TaxID=2016530 RepID=A0A2N3IJJ3_9BACT|nr:TPR repeat [Raineya orbicola]